MKIFYQQFWSINVTLLHLGENYADNENWIIELHVSSVFFSLKVVVLIMFQIF